MNRKSVILLILAFQLTISAFAATPMRLIGALKGNVSGQRLGDACEGLGDINGDGYNDFLVAGRTDRELRLYLGGPHPFDNPPALVLHNHAYDIFSFSPVNIGDIDCDGVNDFISMFGNWDTLKVFTGLENLDSTAFLPILPTPHAAWDYLTMIVGGGDNNDDGRNDFWIRRYRTGISDTIFGYSGCDLLDGVPDVKLLVPKNTDSGYAMSASLCTNCDLNGDGIPDIIVGQLNSKSSSGRVFVFWGGADLSTSADLVFYAPRPHAGNPDFGRDIECLGDISGDGIDDLWVSQGGRNYIYYGGNPFDTTPDVALDWSYMYANVGNVGDVNHDGWNDVMLVREDYLINYISYMYCYPGMDTLVDVVYTYSDYFAAAGWMLCCVGIDHSWAGDIDGDGIDDILISAREDDADFRDNGTFFIQAGWDSIPTDVSNDALPSIPNDLELEQNYPNPFNPWTVIEFTLPRSGYAEMKIYNLLGEIVAIPMQGFLTAGSHRIDWDGLDFDGKPAASGIYFYRLTAGEYTRTRKMVLMK